MPGKSAFDERHGRWRSAPAAVRHDPGCARAGLRAPTCILALGSSLTRTPYGQSIPAGKTILQNYDQRRPTSTRTKPSRSASIGDTRLTIEALFEAVKIEKQTGGKGFGNRARGRRSSRRRRSKRTMDGRTGHRCSTSDDEPISLLSRHSRNQRKTSISKTASSRMMPARRATTMVPFHCRHRTTQLYRLGQDDTLSVSAFRW